MPDFDRTKKLRGHPGRVVALDTLASRLREPPAFGRILEKPFESRRERHGVSGRHEDPALAVGDDLRDRRRSRGHDRQTGSHGLEKHDPKTLLTGGKAEDV